MQIISKQTKIDFIGRRHVSAVLSAILLIASAYSLYSNGLNYGIDFTGGTKVELTYQNDVEINSLRDELTAGGYSDAVVQFFGTSRDILIRVPLSAEHSSAAVSTSIVQILSASSAEQIDVRSVEFVGPQFGQELFEKGLLALIYALIGVMIYVAFRFEWKFSLGAVTALIHDVLITVGLFSILSLEFTLPVLAALLAVIGYSLNDTIVVFDRIRENFRKLRDTDTKDTMNVSINQTLPRTILTSFTTLLVLVALYLFGGEALSGFAATLIIGVLIGTYSSIFVASPTVLALGAKAEDLMVEEVEKEGADHPDMQLP